MQPRAQGSPNRQLFEDPKCRIVLSSAVVPPNTKVFWLWLWERVGFRAGDTQIKLSMAADAIGRDKRTVLHNLRVAEECGLVHVRIKPPEGYSKPSDGIWTLYVGDPAGLLAARRRAYSGQTSLPDCGEQDAAPQSDEADQRDKSVRFYPAENRAFGPSDEAQSSPPLPSDPFGTLGISEPSVPSEAQTNGAQADAAAIAAIQRELRSKQRAEPPPPTIGHVAGSRVAAANDGTHDAYYKAQRERRIRELVRRVGDPKLKTIVAVKVADAEASGALDREETESVLAWMDDKRRSQDGLPIPSQAFVGTMKLVFKRNKIPWPVYGDRER